jgi:hypothetical protein
MFVCGSQGGLVSLTSIHRHRAHGKLKTGPGRPPAELLADGAERLPEVARTGPLADA